MIQSKIKNLSLIPILIFLVTVSVTKIDTVTAASTPPNSKHSVEVPDPNDPSKKIKVCEDEVVLNGTTYHYQLLSIPLQNGDDCIKESVASEPLADNPIFIYLRSIIQFLSAGVGVVVVLMLIISGIQYTTSSANPQALQAAKKRMANAIIGLLLFIFMVAILNFLIPGKLIL